MLAEAFYECRDFKKAENLFKEAIQVKKAMKKSDSSEDNLEVGWLALNSTDVEVSFMRQLLTQTKCTLTLPSFR